MPKAEWEPIELEKVDQGCLARVRRDLYGHGRWKWTVTDLEIVEKWPSNPIEKARARGYSGTCERAIEMADAAIRALGPILAKEKKRIKALKCGG